MSIETADRVHANNTAVALFEDVGPIDWDDLPAAELTQRLIREFAADKALSAAPACHRSPCRT
ncbi:hypothetical protein [Streptomyces sp. SID12501]|uniref:Uncharacterized protein n=1 Tax=Streptomyces sp. SID12501 TaxID=2706042 RepID=A0A6B3BVY1_9ACTN|nr:hypothetical protein [Streptomyces sp. SID12501]NEC88396.1 hypothetical protein [Streptomyces sp. SID12501]